MSFGVCFSAWCLCIHKHHVVLFSFLVRRRPADSFRGLRAPSARGNRPSNSQPPGCNHPHLKTRPRLQAPSQQRLHPLAHRFPSVLMSHRLQLEVFALGGLRAQVIGPAPLHLRGRDERPELGQELRQSLGGGLDLLRLRRRGVVNSRLHFHLRRQVETPGHALL